MRRANGSQHTFAQTQRTPTKVRKVCEVCEERAGRICCRVGGHQCVVWRGGGWSVVAVAVAEEEKKKKNKKK
eukprot:556558-Alexandrium_andersonii.AAC.1